MPLLASVPGYTVPTSIAFLPISPEGHYNQVPIFHEPSRRRDGQHVKNILVLRNLPAIKIALKPPPGFYPESREAIRHEGTQALSLDRRRSLNDCIPRHRVGSASA